jgi:hypothetical protein
VDRRSDLRGCGRAPRLRCAGNGSAGGLTIVFAIFVGASAAAFLLGDQDDATEPAASDQPAADDQ